MILSNQLVYISQELLYCPNKNPGHKKFKYQYLKRLKIVMIMHQHFTVNQMHFRPTHYIHHSNCKEERSIFLELCFLFSASGFLFQSWWQRFWYQNCFSFRLLTTIDKRFALKWMLLFKNDWFLRNINISWKI